VEFVIPSLKPSTLTPELRLGAVMVPLATGIVAELLFLAGLPSIGSR
jgi:hypothetical protein